ncbi:MAG: hypothetical protein NVSMB65_05480 [Chloroflexota bacterium]
MRQIIRARGIVSCLRGLIAFLIVIASPGISRALQRPDAPAAVAATLPVAAQWVYPVGNPAVSPTYWGGNANGYAVTQGFNTSCDPSAGQGHYYAGYYFCGHTGVDLSSDGAYGGMVRAVAAGQVVFAGPDGSYGNMVRIEHLLPDGHIVYSQYEHLGYNTVTVWYGAIVAAGQQIAAVGDSGFAQGAHLHDAVLFLAYRGGMVAVREARMSWVRVTFSNGATGWVLSHYLLLGKMPGAPHPRAASAQRRRTATHRVAAPLRPAPEKAPAAPAGAALSYTWATTLYVRSTPRLAGSVVVLAGENTPVRVLNTHVSWSHVRLADGHEGWVLSHYLKDHPKIYPAQPASASDSH